MAETTIEEYTGLAGNTTFFHKPEKIRSHATFCKCIDCKEYYGEL